MQSLSKPKDVNAPIRQITTDLSSARGGAFDGFSRLLVNCIRDAEGELRRIGGWTRLSPGNGDLHDQLLGAISAPIPAVTSTLEIYNQPDSVTFIAGNGFGFFAEARGGVPPYTWQWYKKVGSVWLAIKDDTNEFGEVAMTNATGFSSHTLSVDGATILDSGYYRVRVTDDHGDSVDSNGALASTDSTATYAVAPVFILQPISQTVYSGAVVKLIASATGIPAPTYKWQKNIATVWTDIIGETEETYQIDAVATGDAGEYRCVATNTEGSVNSTTATLAVLTSTAYGDVERHVSGFVCGQNNPPRTFTLTNPRADQTLTVTWSPVTGTCVGLFSVSPSPVVIGPSATATVTILWDLRPCNAGGEYTDFFLDGVGTFSGGAPGFNVYVDGESDDPCP